jgi:capsular polysaccharide export protein
MPRHFLFLQGLPGPFFNMLAKALVAAGHDVSRINLNGGDWLDWKQTGGINFRSNIERWPGWLQAFMQKQAVTDIILFGEFRPHHKAAMEIASKLALRLYAFEEGYLRPDHVTLEYFVAGKKRPLLRQVAQSVIPVDGRFHRRMRESVRYWIAATIARPIYLHYHSHRFYPAWVEMLSWCRRWLSKGLETRESETALQNVKGRHFFLFPLQLDGDAQIVSHSPFASVADALEHVMDSFAQHAGANSLLLVKRHPYDPDLFNWSRIVHRFAKSKQLTNRVLYVSRADLDPLLDQCAAVVTINSTVGPLALATGKPVHILGQAIYDQPDLVSSGSPDRFWTNPLQQKQGAFADFIQRLKSETQINGGFHSETGLNLLVQNALEQIIRTAE